MNEAEREYSHSRADEIDMIIREALEVDGDERDRHLDSQRDMLLYALALLIGDEPERPQEDVIMKALQDVAIFRV